MRIVGGQWRGKPIEAPAGRDVTRPTTDRVREAMASMVLSACGLDLTGVAVMDAFAGSGAIGLELLSRGASRVTFVDADRRTARLLRKNVESVGAPATAVRILTGDVFRFAKAGHVPGGPFGVLVLDPPYATEAADVSAMVRDLAAAGTLEPGGLVLYERASKRPELDLGDAATVVSQKRYGTTCVDLIRVGKEKNDA